ncbi:hypothetical protein E4U32_006056 [Claviceps aff. humidiphila group G2b]|nr:hypothetical protein E4U32_006056 [Claviceps aff. humidiphila group G2b]
MRPLMNLRCGPGAAILPPEVTRIHLDFAMRMDGGHMGARKFWREKLPRLKYYNPSIPMIVNRHDQNATSPLLKIYLRTKPATADDSTTASAPPPNTQPASSRTNLSKAQPPAPNEEIVTIDMKNKQSSQILEQFLQETRAVPLQPTKEDIEEMQYLEEIRLQGNADREVMRQKREELKREEDMLKRARSAGGVTEDA